MGNDALAAHFVAWLGERDETNLYRTIIGRGADLRCLCLTYRRYFSEFAGETRVDNSSFARDIAVESVDARRVGDLVQGSALIVSKSSTDMRVQYKFGTTPAAAPLKMKQASWKSVRLHGKPNNYKSPPWRPMPKAVKFDVYARNLFELRWSSPENASYVAFFHFMR